MLLLAINHDSDIATIIPTGDDSLIGLIVFCDHTFVAKVFSTIEEIEAYVAEKFSECTISTELLEDSN